MKLKYKGIIRKRTGCLPCGTAKTGIETSHTFYLPSGRSVTFTVGRAKEVSDEDALFLLDETYTDPNGIERKSFEVV